MTDQDLPDFDDPAYDELRGLLAGARSTAPVPDDVVARLDDALAALTADRARTPELTDLGRASTVETPDTETSDTEAPETEAPDLGTPVADVVPLRKRSRLAPRLLVAAAAVLAVGGGGIGLQHVLDDTGSNSLTSADAQAPATASDVPAPAPEAMAPGATAVEPGTAYGSKSLPYAGLPAFTKASFAADAKKYSVRELDRLSFSDEQLRSLSGEVPAPTAPRPGATALNGPVTRAPDTASPQSDTLDGGTSSSLGKGPTDPASGSGSAAGKSCPGPVGTDAEIVTITLDGDLAALAVHPVSKGVQLVEAWSCDGRSVLVATSLQR